MKNVSITHQFYLDALRAEPTTPGHDPKVRWGQGRCLREPRRVASQPHRCSKPREPIAELLRRLDLGRHRKLEVERGDERALIRICSPDPAERIELEIRFEPSGPVVKARAAALELDSATSVRARCETFQVRAEGDIDLEAGGAFRCKAGDAASIEAREFTADASPGAVRLRANDDVQLLGELVLLNCDRLPPMPEWVPEQPAQQPLPLEAASGDAELIAALERAAKDEVAS
jgi:hypothetical protein